jgi:hypothetical protein
MNEKNRREKKANNKRFEQHTNSDQARKIRESFGLPKEKKRKKEKKKGNRGNRTSKADQTITTIPS